MKKLSSILASSMILSYREMGRRLMDACTKLIAAMGGSVEFDLEDPFVVITTKFDGEYRTASLVRVWLHDSAIRGELYSEELNERVVEKHLPLAHDFRYDELLDLLIEKYEQESEND